MPTYELTYLISPELTGGELKNFCQKIDGFVSKSAKIVKSTVPKKIKLSYPIQKKKEAFLATFEFSALPSQTESLKKELKKEKGISRFLLVKKKGILKKVRKPRPTREPKPIPETTTHPPHPPGPKARAPKVELKEIGKKLDKILKE